MRNNISIEQYQQYILQCTPHFKNRLYIQFQENDKTLQNTLYRRIYLDINNCFSNLQQLIRQRDNYPITRLLFWTILQSAEKCCVCISREFIQQLETRLHPAVSSAIVHLLSRGCPHLATMFLPVFGKWHIRCNASFKKLCRLHVKGQQGLFHFFQPNHQPCFRIFEMETRLAS